MPFSITHPSDLFLEPDGETITATYLTFGPGKMPGWIMYAATTMELAGVAPFVAADTYYPLTMYAFDTHGARSDAYQINIKVLPNLLPKLENTDFPLEYTIYSESYFELHFPWDMMIDPEGKYLIFLLENKDLDSNGTLPEWAHWHTFNWTLNGFIQDRIDESFNFNLIGTDQVGGERSLKLVIHVKSLDITMPIILILTFAVVVILAVMIFAIGVCATHVSKKELEEMGFDAKDFINHMTDQE